jgi:hypothetical protein
MRLRSFQGEAAIAAGFLREHVGRGSKIYLSLQGKGFLRKVNS